MARLTSRWNVFVPRCREVVRIKRHQFASDPEVPVVGVNTDIEEFRFLSDVAKADKPDHLRFSRFFRDHHKTGSIGMGDLLDEHLFRPGRRRRGGFHPAHLLQISGLHFSEGVLSNRLRCHVRETLLSSADCSRGRPRPWTQATPYFAVTPVSNSLAAFRTSSSFE